MSFNLGTKKGLRRGGVSYQEKRITRVKVINQVSKWVTTGPLELLYKEKKESRLDNSFREVFSRVQDDEE